MHSILQHIHSYKRVEVRELARHRSELEARAKIASKTRGFRRALQQASTNGYGLIAELKKASPSKGLIRNSFDPAWLARAYAAGGATCLSVLTDAPSFQGSADFLTEAAGAVDLPVLRKDFMIDPLQCSEARLMGADCILLIMAMLGDDQAREIEAVALDHGMDVLIEVHDHRELERAMRLESRLVGINNRNLNDFTVDLGTTISLLDHMDDDCLVVSESGFFTAADLAGMARHGVRCFLVGESLMRQDDVARATMDLLAEPVS